VAHEQSAGESSAPTPSRRPDAYLYGRRAAWFAFVLTIALMICDYADRQVIVSLFPHLKSAWKLSDQQLGNLAAIVSVTVALAGIPVALVADRISRVGSIVLMAAIWSLASIACMFASQYPQLLTARAVIGLGEAGYGSVGAALIASHFPARLRGTVLAGFFASASLGTVLGVLLGGLIAARWGWQAAFGVVGLPGLAIALLYLKVRDYPTTIDRPVAAAGRKAFGFVAAARTIAAIPTLRWVCLGAAAQLLLVSSIWTWLPSFLNRYGGLAPDRASSRAAVVVLLGALGSLLWGRLVDRAGIAQARRKLQVLSALALLSAACAWGAFRGTGTQLPAGEVHFLMILATGFIMTCTVGPVAAITIDVVPLALRATGASVLSLFQNLLGLAAGPAISGFLSDRMGLAAALRVTPLFACLAALLFWCAARAYERDQAQATLVLDA
jgi:MFS transporter, Spinster family, sphingosine-1-phosphate transporter